MKKIIMAVLLSVLFLGAREIKADAGPSCYDKEGNYVECNTTCKDPNTNLEWQCYVEPEEKTSDDSGCSLSSQNQGSFVFFLLIAFGIVSRKQIKK